MSQTIFLSNPQVKLADGNDVDAFGRLRVSQPHAIFDSQNQYDKSPLLWEDVATNNGSTTHLPNESSVRMNVSTPSGDKIVRQTRSYFRYQPGKSLLILMTAQMGALKSNVRQRIGYFDVSNGVFFEQDGTNLKIVLRSNTSGTPTDTPVTQANWNLDKLDGTGSSGITLDMSKVQIFCFDLQWLGVGRVRVGIVVGGTLYPCHEFNAANSATSVYMTTANLPCRLELENTALSGSSTTMKQICCSVSSEAGYDKEGYPFTVGSASSTSVSTRRPILSIRPKLLFNSITNRALILPQNVELLAQSNPIYYEVVYNGSLTNASFSSVHNSSVVEYDVSASAISGGISFQCGFLAASAQGSNKVSSAIDGLLSKISLTLNVAGDTQDVISIVVTGVGGTSSVNAALHWHELYS